MTTEPPEVSQKAIWKRGEKKIRRTQCLLRTKPQKLRKKERNPSCGGSADEARADYNGDGIADLAVGVPLEDIGTAGR